MQVFSNQQIIREFFIDCTVGDMSRFAAGLIKTAMITLYSYEKESISKLNAKFVDPQFSVVEHLNDMPSPAGTVENKSFEQIASHIDVRQEAASAEGSGTPGGSTAGGNGSSAGDKNAFHVYSQCDKVHIFELSSKFNEALPTIVVLINSFLHL